MSPCTPMPDDVYTLSDEADRLLALLVQRLGQAPPAVMERALRDLARHLGVRLPVSEGGPG